MVSKLTFEFRPIAFDDVGADPEPPGTLPRSSGIFRIFDLNGNLILLDKTHNLRHRLERLYTSESHPRSLNLGRITDRVDFCRTDSPLEALYLLNRERRRWFPETHEKMRTHHRFHILKINRRQRFPRLYGTQQLKSGVDYFGPFRTRWEMEQLKAMLERTFNIRRCTYNIRGNDPYPDCLYFQTQGCSRPCNGDITRKAYANDIEAAIAFIQGHEASITDAMMARMQALAAVTRFEEAAEVRKQLERVRRSRKEHSQTYFDLSKFDFVAVMNAGSVKRRKIALVRAGLFLSFEEHTVDDLESTVLSMLRDAGETPPHVGSSSQRYEEFCIVATFLARPVRSVRLVPLRRPEETAREVGNLTKK